MSKEVQTFHTWQYKLYTLYTSWWNLHSKHGMNFGPQKKATRKCFQEGPLIHRVIRGSSPGEMWKLFSEKLLIWKHFRIQIIHFLKFLRSSDPSGLYTYWARASGQMSPLPPSTLITTLTIGCMYCTCACNVDLKMNIISSHYKWSAMLMSVNKLLVKSYTFLHSSIQNLQKICYQAPWRLCLYWQQTFTPSCQQFTTYW